MFVDLGREACGRIGVASNREWLVTNGIGGYAMGTISGMLTRRYHGLLVAALEPPLGRTLMFTKLDETVLYNGEYYPLYIDRWFGGDEEEGGLVEPFGHYNIERFRLVGTTPHWTFAIGDAVLEKRVWMQQGENTTYIQYTLLRASEPLSIYPKAMVNYRDYHKTSIAKNLDTEVDLVPDGIKVTMFPGATPLYLLSNKGEIYPQMEWHEDYFLALEEYRGQPDVVEDHLNIADFAVTLNLGESFTICASTRMNANPNGEAAYEEQRKYEQNIVANAVKIQGVMDAEMEQLVLAADQFIVQRETSPGKYGHSIIAGYPWFGDVGRSTMICIPGITVCSGREDIAQSVLRTYAHFVNKGMLPNQFPAGEAEPQYNTADASLWYFQALRTYMESTNDIQLLRDLFPVMQDILNWYERGTRYGIHVDPEDGLLFAGDESMQLTWMDTKVNDWVVTPRNGKAVEINALWYNALRCMAHFAELLGYSNGTFLEKAKMVSASFDRFWYEEGGYCYDVIDGPGGAVTKLRPNQLFSVSLSYSPFDSEKQQAVLDVCTRFLLTSFGLRTLSPNDEDFVKNYGGDVRKRDAAYHQGTVWGWLIGPFIAAHLRVYKDPKAARSYLAPALRHLRDHGLGSISEIFDGEAPFNPRGCPAMAWSVSEYLRAWCMIHKIEQKKQ